MSTPRDAMSRRVDAAMSKKPNKIDIATLAGRIQTQMTTRGIATESELARLVTKRLGRAVHRQKVHKWLNGESQNMELDALFALADVLECSARWLALKQGGPQKAVQLDVEKTRAVVLYDELAKHEKRNLVDKWLRQGHDLLEAAEPEPTKTVPFRGSPERVR